MKSIVCLETDWTLDDGKVIPIRTCGIEITEEYLKESCFSPEDYEKLLKDAHQARLQGHIYVHFNEYRKCVSIPQNLVF